MKMLAGAALALIVAACATAPQYPATRPLNQTHIDAMRETRVAVNENTMGVTKSWFMQDSSAAGASQGLIGALVSVAYDAIVNAGPSRRARKAATEINDLLTPEMITASLVAQLEAQMPGANMATTTALATEVESAGAAPSEAAVATDAAATAPVSVVEPAAPTGVVFAEVTTVQKLLEPDAINDTIEISTSYVLSEDSSTFRVIASVSYQNEAIPYATPYTFEGETPRAEQSGALYRNTFTYYSEQLPIPVMSPELRERLIENIQQSYNDANGQPPAADTDEYRAMDRELEKARDNEFSRSEIAIFLTREWLRDDAAMLRREIERAHAFIARYVALDLNSTAIPSLTGQDALLETMADNRTVRRYGAGTQAGSYISSPGSVNTFASFGNAIGVAEPNMRRTNELYERGRRARRNN